MKHSKLTAYIGKGIPATPQTVDQVKYFLNDDSTLAVKQWGEGTYLKTANGTYPLEKHPKHNYYHCVANDTKVQVSIKKMVAEVRWWVKK